MSHFVGLCFGEWWESNIDQYDEGLQVDAYIAYTKEEAINEAKERVASNYKYAKERLQEASISSHQQDYYRKLMETGPIITDTEAWEIAKDWGYEIDEEENLLTHYNPDSKWDWYSVGGRWSGFLPLKDRDPEGDPLTANEAYVGEIDWDYMIENKFPPFCFVDEDGEWHEKGEMGWFAVVKDESPEEEWIKEFREYIDSVDEDCLVTVVDFHI